MKCAGKVSYELDLPLDLAVVHPIFPVSMLRRCTGDPYLVVLVESIGVKDSFSYKEITVHILDRQIQRLRIQDFTLVKVHWINQMIEGETWEAEEDMMS